MISCQIVNLHFPVVAETKSIGAGAEIEADQFAILKPWLAGDAELLPQSEAATQLAMSESAVKVGIHRLRKRFREMIRAEISQTVDQPADVDRELSYLVEVLARR